jgi:hypothetical protein
MPKYSQEEILKLELSERLYVLHDLQNDYDPKALLLRTKGNYNLGYCPRYLAEEICDFLEQNPKSIYVQVERVNCAPTPIQYRVLCNMTLECPTDFSLFSSLNYQSIIENPYLSLKNSTSSLVTHCYS